MCDTIHVRHHPCDTTHVSPTIHVTSPMCDTIHVTSPMCDTIHVTPPMCDAIHVTPPMCDTIHVTSPMCDTIHVTSPMCDTIHVTPPMCHHPCDITHVRHHPCNIIHVRHHPCDTTHVSPSMCDTGAALPTQQQLRPDLLQRGRCHMVGVQYNKKVHSTATWKASHGGCAVQKKGSLYCNVEGVTWWVCSTKKRFTLLQRGRRHMVGVQYNKKVHSTATWKASRGGCAVQITGSPQFRNSQVVRWRVCVCNNCFLLPGRSCYLEGVTWWMYGATKRFTAI